MKHRRAQLKVKLIPFIVDAGTSLDSRAIYSCYFLPATGVY